MDEHAQAITIEFLAEFSPDKIPFSFAAGLFTSLVYTTTIIHLNVSPYNGGYLPRLFKDQ